jgi:hypothetical protein
MKSALPSILRLRRWCYDEVEKFTEVEGEELGIGN